MFKRLTRLGSFGNITSNGNFQSTIPLQGAITNVHIVTLNANGLPTALVEGTLDSVGLTAGDAGDVVSPLAPADLVSTTLFKFAGRGYQTIAGLTPLYVAPPNPSETERMAYMIGTNGLSGLTVDIDTGNLANGGNDAITQIEIWGERLTGGGFDDMGLGRHIRLSKETITTTGTGEKSFDNFPYVNKSGTRLMCLHVKNASGTGVVNKAKVEVNEMPEHLAHMVTHEFAQRMAGRTPQANVFAIDFSLQNNGNAGLPLQGVSRLNLTANWSVDPAAAHDVIVETLHGVDEAAGY